LNLSVNDPYSRFERDDLRNALAATKLERPIGSRHAYSNYGTGLLGVALAEAATDGDVDRLFEERMLTPLELSDTTFSLDEDQQSRLAPPFLAAGLPASEWH